MFYLPIYYVSHGTVFSLGHSQADWLNCLAFYCQLSYTMYNLQSL